MLKGSAYQTPLASISIARSDLHSLPIYGRSYLNLGYERAFARSCFALPLCRNHREARKHLLSHSFLIHLAGKQWLPALDPKTICSLIYWFVPKQAAIVSWFGHMHVYLLDVLCLKMSSGPPYVVELQLPPAPAKMVKSKGWWELQFRNIQRAKGSPDLGFFSLNNSSIIIF